MKTNENEELETHCDPSSEATTEELSSERTNDQQDEQPDIALNTRDSLDDNQDALSESPPPCDFCIGQLNSDKEDDNPHNGASGQVSGNSDNVTFNFKGPVENLDTGPKFVHNTVINKIHNYNYTSDTAETNVSSLDTGKYEVKQG